MYRRLWLPLVLLLIAISLIAMGNIIRTDGRTRYTRGNLSSSDVAGIDNYQPVDDPWIKLNPENYSAEASGSWPSVNAYRRVLVNDGNLRPVDRFTLGTFVKYKQTGDSGWEYAQIIGIVRNYLYLYSGTDYGLQNAIAFTDLYIAYGNSAPGAPNTFRDSLVAAQLNAYGSTTHTVSSAEYIVSISGSRVFVSLGLSGSATAGSLFLNIPVPVQIPQIYKNGIAMNAASPAPYVPGAYVAAFSEDPAIVGQAVISQNSDITLPANVFLSKISGGTFGGDFDLGMQYNYSLNTLPQYYE